VGFTHTDIRNKVAPNVGRHFVAYVGVRTLVYNLHLATLSLFWYKPNLYVGVGEGKPTSAVALRTSVCVKPTNVRLLGIRLHHGIVWWAYPGYLDRAY